jgi:hypothetical protein
MAQIFHRSFNVISRLTIFGAVFVIAFLGWAFYVLAQSPYLTNVGVTRDQPVPFSHAHHVGQLGIDCRYCHDAAEKSSFAGMPPVKTCMNCHEQIWTGSEMLQPVREAYAKGETLPWERVHRLADFAYFNHSVHVNHGVGCASCHGPVNEMPLMYQHGTLLMQWCLDCHRNPEPKLRPKEKVYDIDWQWGPGKDAIQEGHKLAEEFHTPGPRKLTDCSTCHR